LVINSTFSVTTARVLAGRTAVVKKAYNILNKRISDFPFFHYNSMQFKQEPGAHQITREWALRRRRPRGGSSGLARASCALWRARPCGLNQIRPPSKTQAFLGRPNFAHPPALSERRLADEGSSFKTISVRGALGCTSHTANIYNNNNRQERLSIFKILMKYCLTIINLFIKINKEFTLY